MIQIAFPDIPFNAANIVVSPNTEDFHNHFNLYRGRRYQHARFANTADSRDLIFTLNDNNFQGVNYLILARADLLMQANVTNLTLARSSDGTTFTNVLNYTLNAAHLRGFRRQDILRNIGETASYKYWRARFDSAGASAMKFSKLYFGKMFDIGVAPDSIDPSLIETTTQTFVADSGAEHQMQQSTSKFQIRIVWDGVTDAKKTEFDAKVLRHKSGLFLHTTDSRLLNGQTLMHVSLENYQADDIEGFPNWNRISCSFVEQLG